MGQEIYLTIGMKKNGAERGRPRSFDRDLALHRAMEVFWARGYEGASIGDLTAAMGIERPSLYAAFGCKEALFRQAVELYRGQGLTRQALADAPTARDAVAAMLRTNAIHYASPGQPRGCLVVLAAVVGTEASAEVRAELAAMREEVRSAVEARIRQGIGEGDVSAAADPALMASFYCTVLNGLSLQARDGRSAEDLIAIGTAAMAAWDALAGPP